MQYACVLKSGPTYRPEYLYGMVNGLLAYNRGARVVCLTDMPISHKRIDVVPLERGWPGWWSKIELFKPGLLEGETLYLDIDTVVVGGLAGLKIDGFTMLQDVYTPGAFGSGLMAWNSPPTEVYKRFCKAPEHFMAQCTTRRMWGDQGFIQDTLGRCPKIFGPEMRSYKKHCRRGVPSGTKIVYFHGNPRPWDVRRNWVQRQYQ